MREHRGGMGGGGTAVCTKVNSIEFLQFLMPAAHITTPATPRPVQHTQNNSLLRGSTEGWGSREQEQRGVATLGSRTAETRRIFLSLQAVGSWQRACDLLGIDILMMCLGALSPHSPHPSAPLCLRHCARPPMPSCTFAICPA